MGDRRAVTSPQNSQLSTGPVTAEGKQIIASNRVTHGLRSARVVVPGLEDPALWEAHRAAVLDDLRPVGALEAALAGRVAELLWRLGRVVEAETVAIEAYREDARGALDAAVKDPEQAGALLDPDELPLVLEGREVVSLRDEVERRTGRIRRQLAAHERRIKFLDGLAELPDGAAIDVDLGRAVAEAAYDLLEDDGGLDLDLDGERAGDLRGVLGEIGAAGGQTVEQVLQAVRRCWDEEAGQWRAALERFAPCPGNLDRRSDRLVERLATRRCLPPKATAEVVIRSEAHLGKQLDRALAQLREQQARRLGLATAPRIVVGVVVHNTGGDDAPVALNGRNAPALGHEVRIDGLVHDEPEVEFDAHRRRGDRCQSGR
jgi:hypothetical protein